VLFFSQEPGLSCTDEAHRVRFHFVREILEEGDIELLKIHISENLADMLTKVVSGVKFAHCKALLHVLHVS